MEARVAIAQTRKHEDVDFTEAFRCADTSTNLESVHIRKNNVEENHVGTIAAVYSSPMSRRQRLLRVALCVRVVLREDVVARLVNDENHQLRLITFITDRDRRAQKSYPSITNL